MRSATITILGLLAQLVEHIVHIDGVTGSSPVQTTKKTRHSFECLVFLSKCRVIVFLRNARIARRREGLTDMAVLGKGIEIILRNDDMIEQVDAEDT